MNAADYYGLDELRRACMGFVTCCITVDTVNSILASAERYIQYKCTKSLVQRVSVCPLILDIKTKQIEIYYFYTRDKCLLDIAMILLFIPKDFLSISLFNFFFVLF